jgi:signal transduction histidine kinase
MDQKLFIETFVLGSAVIAGFYHLMLFIQQRDKYLLSYSVYLFTLSSYIIFKLSSNNYSPFEPTTNVAYFILEECLQVVMGCVYATFAAITVDAVQKPSLVRTGWIILLFVGAGSIAIHIYKSLTVYPCIMERSDYAISRFTIIAVAIMALLLAWRERTSFFYRTIIVGSLVYAFGGLLSAISFTFNTKVLGVEGVEPYLLCCLIDIVIFSAAFGYRIKMVSDEKNKLLKRELDNQLALEKVRVAIASDLHDNVGATLSSIHIYTDSVKNNIEKGDTNKAIRILKQIGSDCRETIDAMSDIVWAINPKNEPLDKMTLRMKSFAANILSAKGIQINFEIQESFINQEWEMIKRKNTYLIFKEAINNAAKYSCAKNLKVKLGLEGSKAIMQIVDDGIGFEIENADSGNGLNNMHTRAKEINAELKIDSKKGEGCSITFTV